MTETKDRPGLDDPIWEYIVRERCEKYIPYVKDWWSCIKEHDFVDTGVYSLTN